MGSWGPVTRGSLKRCRLSYPWRSSNITVVLQKKTQSGVLTCPSTVTFRANFHGVQIGFSARQLIFMIWFSLAVDHHAA